MVGIAVSGLTVEYPAADGYIVRALDGFDLAADDGEFVLLLGPSGSGKTTLLSCLAGILTPTSGRVEVAGVDVTALRGEVLNAYRRHSVGVVFQGFNLIDSLSALENVAVPLRLVGGRRADARAAAMGLLERVGLASRAQHRPGQLSGGQQQRVAIARALALQPPVLLADEPTAHLDHVQVEGVIGLLRGLAAPGRVVLVSTHDDRLVPLADRVVELQARVASPASSPGEVRLAAGEVLFEQGSPSDLVYVVVDGEVELYQRGTDAVEQPITRLGPGQHFGEMGPMLGLPRSASARATTPTTLAAHTVTEFRNLAGVAERRRWRAGAHQQTAPQQTVPQQTAPQQTAPQATGEHDRRSNNALAAEADLRAVLQAYWAGDWETVHGYLPEDILLVDESAGVTVRGAEACLRFLRARQEAAAAQQPELVGVDVRDGDLRALVELLPVDGAPGPAQTASRWCVDVTVGAHGFVRELRLQRVAASVQVPRQDEWPPVSADPAATS